MEYVPQGRPSFRQFRTRMARLHASSSPPPALHPLLPTMSLMPLFHLPSRASPTIAAPCSRDISLPWVTEFQKSAFASHSSASMEFQEFSEVAESIAESTRLLEQMHYGTMMANMVWYLCMVATACTELFPIYRTYSLEAGHTCIH